jgi:Ni,Fe-hydrogenase III small subunit
MSLALKALKKSPWVFHVNTGACNNCDIEILDCLTPRFDVERFGVVLVGSVRHADVLLISGPVTKNVLPRLKRLYDAAPRPIKVVALGACGLRCGIFRDAYNVVGPLDKHIPVDVYIPGCPPKPETIIAGLVKVLSTL